MGKTNFEDFIPLAAPILAGVGNALGIGEGRQDRRQIKQQKELTKIQEEANKRQAQLSQQLGMKTWNETNYGAQTEHMRDAGLNIGLMYGMGGGGGTTTGSASAQGVSGGSASDSASASNANTAATGMGLQMASQLALMKAQKENIEADTENKKAGAGKATTETEGITQDNKVKTVNAENIERLKDELRDAMLGEAKSKSAQGVVDEQTTNEKIEQIQTDLATAKVAQDLEKQKIKLTEAQINEIREKIAQGWKTLEFQGTDKIYGKYLEEAVNWVRGLKKK